MHKILLLEINEVPWKIINKYKTKYKNIKLFFEKADKYKTICSDKIGMLDPWLIWPTVHRGMNYKKHNIKNLGQDPNTFKGNPIWKEYRQKGFNIGVFGSLQSWPPIEPGNGGFYIPDTFAHNKACYPNSLEFFQEFNLEQVSENGRVVKRTSYISFKSLLIFLRLLRFLKIRTIFRIIKQLILELYDKSFYERRPIYQSIICWDIFKYLYFKKNPPQFASFFTNHVANVMHRYWKHIFPEDFMEKSTKFNKEHKKTIDFAMQILDEILADTMKLDKKLKNIKVFFISGMGQEAVIYENHEGLEAAIVSVENLMKSIGIDRSKYNKRLAMVPQVALEVKNQNVRKTIIDEINSIETASGRKIFAILEEGNSLNISIITPKKLDIEKGYFIITNEKNKKISWDHGGIKFNKVEPGSAYHIPEGSMAILNCESKYKNIMTADIKDIILKEGGLIN